MSEFTAKIRDRWLAEAPNTDSTLDYAICAILDLCKRLDTSKARVKDLLVALEEASRDFYYIHQHSEDAHVDSYNFMEKVKQAKKVDK